MECIFFTLFLHLKGTNSSKVKSSMRLEEFNKNYALYYKRCILFAQSYLHDSDLAADIVSESMVVLWEYLSEKKEIDAPVPFLFSVIKNKILHCFRHKYVKQAAHQLLETEGTDEVNFQINSLESYEPHQLYSKDLERLIKLSLKKLNEQTYKVFMLSRFKAMSNREIAEVMGISVKGVEYHMSKALKQLREDLKEYLK